MYRRRWETKEKRIKTKEEKEIETTTKMETKKKERETMCSLSISRRERRKRRSVRCFYERLGLSRLQPKRIGALNDPSPSSFYEHSTPSSTPWLPFQHHHHYYYHPSRKIYGDSFFAILSALLTLSHTATKYIYIYINIYSRTSTWVAQIRLVTSILFAL